MVLDPVTKQFLQRELNPIFGFPHLVRFSWSTSENILEKDAYLVEWEKLKDESKTPDSNTKINSFFAVKSSEVKPKHRFFSERGLHSVTKF